VFDPDLDPDGRYSRVVTDVLADGLGRLGVAAAQNPGPAIPVDGGP
jgi:arginase